MIVVAATYASLGDASQVPVFKGRLDLVRTEVAVIDNKTGKAVTGLTERDFTISENGVKQTIASFAEEATPAAARIPGAAEVSALEADRQRRVFLFIVTVNPSYDGPYKVYEGLARFIRESLQPKDLVGLMAFSRLSELTADHERIAAIVDRMRKPPSQFVNIINGRRTRGDLSEDSERALDEWFEPGSSSKGFFRSAANHLIGTPEYRANDAADTVRSWKLRVLGNEPLKVVAGIEYLRRITGDKHIVLLSNQGVGPPPVLFANEAIGLRLESTEDDRRFAARANDAGVAIDIIQTAGASGAGDLFSIMSNSNVAEHSGGLFSGVRVAAQQLARIDDASRHGYVLGYMPSNPELDGKYRNIKVTVNKKEVSIVYRRGYTARPDPGPAEAREVYTKSRMRDAAVGNTNLTDLKIQIESASLVSKDGKREVTVDLGIDISTVPLVETNGKWEGDIDLLVLCGDVKQNVVGGVGQHMKLSMTQGLYDQAKASGVPYSAQISVTGQPALVKAIVFNFESDRLGTAAAKIR